MTTYTINHDERTVSTDTANEALLNREFKALLTQKVKEHNGVLTVDATLNLPAPAGGGNAQFTVVIDEHLHLTAYRAEMPYGMMDIFNHDRTGSIHISPYLISIDIKDKEED